MSGDDIVQGGNRGSGREHKSKRWNAGERLHKSVNHFEGKSWVFLCFGEGRRAVAMRIGDDLLFRAETQLLADRSRDQQLCSCT